ncbi:MAG TPA: nitroreductase family deazaflavin-dependent oxidoreductase [Acidimicrobiales bacterium]|nr:nitroreductase family deazaflavin-dependent oxidoreductase [Acidimicrobiales bacterium]
MSDFNTKIVDVFRSNSGKVGGPFDGARILLLHHTGAKTGRERVNPLAYQALGDGFAVFASKGGSPNNPDWYHNLLANPEATIEVGTDTVPVRARELTGDARSEVWERQKVVMPGFADYEKNTSGIRDIPVVLLERRR